MKLWEVNQDINGMIAGLVNKYHQHLALAKIIAFFSDSKCVSGNRIIFTKASKCTSTEKCKTGADFKIIIIADSWSKLTDAQREIVLDEALCNFTVKYVPEVIIVNKKEVPVKDDWGRIKYTSEIFYNDDNKPVFKLTKPDLSIWYELISRHKTYNEELARLSSILCGVN